MLIDYVSDIHISHYVPFKPSQERWATATKSWVKKLIGKPKGEILIIAGDISEWNQQIKWFLEESSKHYNSVYFTTGNHDYYLLSNNQKKKFGSSVNKIKKLVKDISHLNNVIHLDGYISIYKDITIAGHSMWYNLPKPEDEFWYRTNSNDNNYVYGENGRHHSYKELYKKSIDWYNTLEGLNIDIMVSHFPPVNPPTSNYKDIACYRTDVPFLTGKHWVCGHQHIEDKFKLLDTNFYMNPIGYPIEKLSKKIKTFEL